jgi:hypothetical protein
MFFGMASRLLSDGFILRISVWENVIGIILGIMLGMQERTQYVGK